MAAPQTFFLKTDAWDWIDPTNSNNQLSCLLRVWQGTLVSDGAQRAIISFEASIPSLGIHERFSQADFEPVFRFQRNRSTYEDPKTLGPRLTVALHQMERLPKDLREEAIKRAREIWESYLTWHDEQTAQAAPPPREADSSTWIG